MKHIKIIKSEFEAAFNELNGTMKAMDIYKSLANKYEISVSDVKDIIAALEFSVKRFREKATIELVDEEPAMEPAVMQIPFEGQNNVTNF